MANFEDITGWRGELEAFKQTEGGRAYFSAPTIGPDITPSPGPKVKLSNLMECAELYLKHKELTRLIDLYLEWESIDASMTDLFDERHPDYRKEFSEMFKAKAEFGRWYFMKTRIPFNDLHVNTGATIAIYVRQGKFSAARSQETVDYYKADQQSSRNLFANTIELDNWDN
ncbi:MAG: hypothetical protein AAF468_19420 [Pseudomonadota bacterium]